MDRWQTKETVDGEEESEAGVDEVSKMGIRCGTMDERGQEGQTNLEGTTEEEEADTEVGTTASDGVTYEPKNERVFGGQRRHMGRAYGRHARSGESRHAKVFGTRRWSNRRRDTRGTRGAESGMRSE